MAAVTDDLVRRAQAMVDDPQWLDEWVYEVACEEHDDPDTAERVAAEVNAAGFAEQVAYLLDSQGGEEVVTAIARRSAGVSGGW